MRRSELGNLKVEDVNLDKNRIYVRGGKGDRDRVIPMHPDLIEGLSELVRGKTNKESVFVSSHVVWATNLETGLIVLVWIYTHIAFGTISPQPSLKRGRI